MDLETAGIINPQYYQPPCSSEKVEGEIRDSCQLPLLTQQKLMAAPLRRGYSRWDGTVAKSHFGCSCFRLSLRDNVSARPLPELCPTYPHSQQLCFLQEVQQHLWGGNLHSCTHGQLCFLLFFGSYYLCMWKHIACAVFSPKTSPCPMFWCFTHKQQHETLRIPEWSSVSPNSSGMVKQQVYWQSGRADPGKKPHYVGCARELAAWMLGSCQSFFCECDMNHAHVHASWKRWLFLILLVKGRWHCFIQITLICATHSKNRQEHCKSADCHGHVFIWNFNCRLFCFTWSWFYWFGSLDHPMFLRDQQHIITITLAHLEEGFGIRALKNIKQRLLFYSGNKSIALLLLLGNLEPSSLLAKHWLRWSSASREFSFLVLFQLEECAQTSCCCCFAF